MNSESLFNAGRSGGVVPEGEKARQAVDSLKGYAYQILAATLAWTYLDDHGRIYLEVAEDYAVVVESAIRAHQVKNTAAIQQITLNSPGVKKAVAAFVDLYERNPNCHVELRFFTTATIGTESALADRPMGMAGLRYWNQVADGADPTPLRGALESTRFPASVRKFSKSRSTEELRSDLVRRIRWDCGAPGYARLREELEASLIVFCRKNHQLPSAEAIALVAPLLYRVLETSVRPASDQRVLTRAELHRSVDRCTRVSVPRAAAELLVRNAVSSQGSASRGRSAVVADSESSVLVDGSTLPVPSGRIRRVSLESTLGNTLNRFRVAVVVGATGVGKSAVSRTVASARTGKFFVTEFRKLDVDETRIRLDVMLGRAGNLSPALVILDDLNCLDDTRGELAFSRVLEALRRRHCEVIVTCYRAPGSRILNQVGLDAACVIRCEYFSEKDVNVLVRSRGGDSQRWGRLAYIAGGSGHPQLTDAFVTGIAARGWDVGEIDRVYRQNLSSEATEAARDATRRTLASALSDRARMLLYRLSIAIGRFERPMALTIGELHPPVVGAGECLDELVGPWIEEVESNLLRVCPLASDLGKQMLPLEEQLQVHNTIAWTVCKKGRIGVEDADAILVHGIAGKSENSLAMLAFAVMSAAEDTLEMLGEHLFALPKMRTDVAIYPEDGAVSIGLRIAQFKLVAAKRDRRAAADIANVLFKEVEEMADGEERRRLEALCLLSVLCTRGAVAYLDNWMELLMKLIGIVPDEKAFEAILGALEHSRQPTRGQFLGVLFGLGMSEVESVSQLESVVDKLDQLNADARQALLTRVDDRFADYSELVHLPWTKGVPSSSEIAEGIAGYERMAQKAREWGFRELSLQCSVAQAIMLDEFCSDKDRALAVLDRAAEATGQHIILGRAVARIHWRQGEHATALRRFRSIVDCIGDLNPIDRAFALREAAISAARTGEWRQAATWFLDAQRAAEAASGTDMMAMAIGLGADAAVAALEVGEVDEALRGLMGAVESLDRIDAKGTLRSAYCHHVIRHTVLWMYARMTSAEIKVGGQAVWLEAGTCSNPEPAAAFQGRPLAHVDLAWYLMAEVEIATGIEVGVHGRLEERVGENRYPAMDLRLRMEVMRRAIDRVDADGFARGFREYIEAAVYVSKERRQLEKSWDSLAPDRGRIPKLDAGRLGEGRAEDAARESILAYGVCASVKGQKGGMDGLERALVREFEAGWPGERMCRAWRGRLEDLTDLECAVIDVIRDLESDEYMGPEQVWAAGARLYQWCGQGNFAGVLVVRLAEWQKKAWGRVVDVEGFRLVRPWVTVPKICSLLESGRDDGQFVTEMIVAGAEAVGARLTTQYLAQLQATRE